MYVSLSSLIWYENLKIFDKIFFVENYLQKKWLKNVKNTRVIFKCKYFVNKRITQKTVRHIHSSPLEVWGIRSKTLVAHSYMYVGLLPFTLKMTKNTSFLMIFMIKTVGGVYIPPGILINIHDKETLRIEIETPDLTG